MFCTNCGNQVEDGLAFCGNCGTAVEKVPVPAGNAAASDDALSAAPAAAPPIPESYPDISVPPVYQERPVPPPVYQSAPAPDYYGVPAEPAVSSSPLVLRTNRAWWKLFLLGIITLGIYPMIAQELMVHELNITTSRYDGKRTLSPLLMVFLSVLTLTVFYFVWWHGYSKRLGHELKRRGISYSMSPAQFWLMCILGGITIVLPCVFMHRIIKATNLINNDFNQTGR
ncbi:MAG: DUF4234 domain-containing protein [Ruminococcus sp.]|nr:DUF4234 domain-containing protein [Ruminococcus sp.]